MKLIRPILITLLAFYILTFAYIFMVAWQNGISETVKDALLYAAVGGVFGLLAERLYQRIRRRKR